MTRHIPLLTTLLLLACGGAQSSAATGNTFSGPNELDFVVMTPIRRQLPPERHRGSAEVVSDDGSLVTLELRMVEGGDACRITAARSGTEPLQVQPGECSSRFVYEENPTSAVVRIEQGTVTMDDRSMSVGLSGRFVANVRSGEGTTELSGVAEWSFEGRR